MRKQFAVCLSLVLLAGCHGLGMSSELTTSPEDWAEYEGHTVTVKGSAGNSPQGAIVRLSDGGYIPLKTRVRWGIDAVGRPIVVTGKVVSGQGFRTEKFILDASSEAGGRIEVPPPDQSAKPAAESGL
ncbi:MAG: hypothetical protein QM754_05565 [Tepidisphaeraceae bacterium]